MSDFVQAVAERCDVAAEDAQAVLEEYGVRAWVAPLPTPALSLEALRFKGRKPGASHEYQFEWPLGQGVWALSSDDNDVGKSSALEVIRWLLSGRDSVDRVVRTMIAEASLRFSIDDTPFTVEVSGDRGDTSGRVSVGSVSQSFTSASFEATMDELMLERLVLRPLGQWQKHKGSEDGRPTRLGWQAFVPALFLPAPSSKSLLGEVPQQAGMLLQVFLGLPWYTTERQAALAVAQVAQGVRDQDRRADRDRGEDRELIAAAEAERERARAVLADLPDRRKAAAELQEASAAVMDATRALIESRAVRDAADQDRVAAEDAVVLARRAVRIARETVAAGGVFSELKAEACPRCELAIGADRREAETASRLCMVCGREHGEPLEESAEAVTIATERLAQAEMVRDEVAARAGSCAQTVQEAENDLAAAERGVTDAEPAANLLEQRAEATAAVARAEGRLEELARRNARAKSPRKEHVLAVLKAAQSEARDRMGDAQLLDELNAQVLELAHRFGMTDIEAVKLDRRAALPVTKHGITQPFGEVSPSEKLRLRIATVIALLRVAQVGGPARHPGLIVIDSPAAEEVADANLDEMLTELESLAGDIGRLQVLLATTRADAVAAALPPERIKHVPEGHTLW